MRDEIDTMQTHNGLLPTVALDDGRCSALVRSATRDEPYFFHSGRYLFLRAARHGRDGPVRSHGHASAPSGGGAGGWRAARAAWGRVTLAPAGVYLAAAAVVQAAASLVATEFISLTPHGLAAWAPLDFRRGGFDTWCSALPIVLLFPWLAAAFWAALGNLARFYAGFKELAAHKDTLDDLVFCGAYAFALAPFTALLPLVLAAPDACLRLGGGGDDDHADGVGGGTTCAGDSVINLEPFVVLFVLETTLVVASIVALLNLKMMRLELEKRAKARQIQYSSSCHALLSTHSESPVSARESSLCLRCGSRCGVNEL